MVDAKYIDTFLYSKQMIWLLDQHIQRLKWAAEFHQLNFDSNYIKDVYSQMTKNLDASDYILRFVWNLCDLTYTYNIKPLDHLTSPIKLILATTAKLDKDPYKKNDRLFWMNQTAELNMSTHDIISFNSNGDVIETSRFNLFLLKDTVCVTPTIDSGCVNGCFRQYALKKGFITIDHRHYPLVEDSISFKDIKTYPLYVANSVRGLIPAQFTK